MSLRMHPKINGSRENMRKVDNKEKRMIMKSSLNHQLKRPSDNQLLFMSDNKEIEYVRRKLRKEGGNINSTLPVNITSKELRKRFRGAYACLKCKEIIIMMLGNRIPGFTVF